MDSPQKAKHTRMQVLTSDEDEAESCIQKVTINEDEFRRHHGTPATTKNQDSDESGIKQFLPQQVQTPETLQINRRAQVNLSSQQPKRLQFPQGEQGYQTVSHLRKESDHLELQSDAVRMSMEQVARDVFTPRRPITIRRKDYTEPRPEPPYQFKEKAIPLVTVTSNGKFEINQDVVHMMEHVRGPIGVVAVAGMYRTGKSYLLNRLLLNRKRGFNVGPSINPCTKGIWIWGTPLKSFTEKGEPCSVLIVDSEGMGGFDEDNNHDMRIFSLALLLSSYFIYNSMSQIDENALQNLSLVVNLTKHIQTTAGQQQELDQYLPTFMWVVRDFALQLQDEDGNNITDREYLETALQQKGNSKTDPKNQIRAALLRHFKKRDCCTMIRPSVDEEMLQKLEEMELEDLRSEFVEQVVNLRKKVLGTITVKKFNGTPMDGSTWIGLLKQYTQAFNEDRVPNVDSSWSYICRQRAEQSLIKATEYFESTLEEIQIPFHQDELQQYLAQSQTQSLQMFNQALLDPMICKDALKRLQEWLSDRIEELATQNLHSCYEQAQLLLQESFQQIDQFKSMLGDPFISQQIELALQQLAEFYDEHCFQFTDKKLCLLEREGRFYREVCGETGRYWQNQSKGWEMQMQQWQEDERRKLASVKEEFLSEMQQIKSDSKLQADKRVAQEEVKFQEMVQEKEFRLKELQVQHDHELTSMLHQLQTCQQQYRSLQDESENNLKETQRQHKQQLSQIDMESSLNKHQIQYLQEQLKEAQTKQQSQLEEYLQSMGVLQQQQSSSKRQWEEKCKQYELNIQAKDEQIWQLEQQLNEVQQSIVVTLEQQSMKDQQFRQQIEELKKQPAPQMQQKPVQTYLKQYEECQVLIKSLQEREAQLKHEHGKEVSLKEQKIHFLQVEVQEVREQLEMVQGQHYGVIQMLESSPQKEVQQGLVQELERQLEQQYQELTQTRQQLDQVELSKATTERELEHLQAELKLSQLKTAQLQNDCGQAKLEMQAKIDKQSKDLQAANYALSVQIDQLKTQQTVQLQQLQDRLSEEHQSQMLELQSQHTADVSKMQKQLQDERERSQKRAQQLMDANEKQQQQLIDQNQQEISRMEDKWAIIQQQSDQDLSLVQQEKLTAQNELARISKVILEDKEKSKKKLIALQDEISKKDEALKACEIEIGARVKDCHEYTSTIKQLQTQIETKNQDFKNKSDQMQMSLTNKQTELVQLQSKYESAKKQKQQAIDEQQQFGFQQDKEKALLQQEITFQKQRNIEVQQQFQDQQKYYETKLDQSCKELQEELQEQALKAAKDKEEFDIKYDIKRKQNQSLEQQLVQLTAALQQVQAQRDELQTELSALQEQLQQLMDVPQTTDESANRYKGTIQQLEIQLQDVTAQLDTDRALWTQKQQFLETQKESYKRERDEQQKKFEMLIEQLGKRSEKEKIQNELNLKNVVKMIESKNRQQVQEIQQAQCIVVQEWQQKFMRLEYTNQKLLEKEKEWQSNEGHDDLQGKLEVAIRERDQVQQELQKVVTQLQAQIAKDKDIHKAKMGEVERKLKDVEIAKKSLFYQAEQDRAQWMVQADQYLGKVQELQDQIFGLERTRDLLKRENDKLKGSESRSQHGVSPGVPRFTLNTAQIKQLDSQGQGANKVGHLQGQQVTKQSNRYKMTQPFASTEDN